MQRITSIDELELLENNYIQCEDNDFSMERSYISFEGKNNYLVIEKGAKLVNAKINFHGSNAIVYIKKTADNQIKMTINIYDQSFIFIDEGVSVNVGIRIIVSESKYLVIGKDCMFSRGIWIRNNDVHLIYNIETEKRMAISRNMVIGNHVWFGQDARIMKAPFIGSGSIIGISSVVKGLVENNTIHTGNPATLQKKGILWDRQSSHRFSREDTSASIPLSEELKTNFDFQGEDNQNLWKEYLERISEMPTSEKKVVAIGKITHLPYLVVALKEKSNSKKWWQFSNKL